MQAIRKIIRDAVLIERFKLNFTFSMARSFSNPPNASLAI